MVCEFPDVFPNELSGFHPKERLILILDAQPISKTSFMIAPIELKELKN